MSEPSATVPAEYLVVFREELARGASDYAAEMAAMAGGGDDAASAFEVYAGQLARAAETAEIIGLAALARIARHIEANVVPIGAQPAAARAALLERLFEWPARFTAYLEAPAEPTAAHALVDYVAKGGWPAPLTADALVPLPAELIVAIEEATVSDEGAPSTPEPEPVTAAEMVLAVPRDVDEGVRAAYLAEAPEHVEQLLALTPRIAAGEASADERRAAERYAHSLKGSSNIVGVRGVALLAHPLEDVFEVLRERTEPVDSRLAAFVLDSTNLLAQMVGVVMGLEERPVDALERVNLARRVAWRIAAGDLDGALAMLPERPASRPIDPRAIDARPAPRASVDESSPPAAAAPANLNAAVLRVPVKTIDELFRLLGELGMRVLRLQTELRDTRHQTRAMRETLEAATETIANRRADARTDPQDDPGANAPPEHESVELIAQMLDGIRGVDTRLAALTGDIEEQERLQRELGRIALSTRMLPVATLVPRLRRNVQQTCRQLGKDAVLRVTGEEILCDGDMLESLADPLLHILRNAIDHGIEDAATRVAAGKPEAGLVELEFARRGPVVTVSVRDDGRGLDYAAIRAKAISNGLMHRDAQLSRGELAQLTLLPGFSTKAAVSEVSGRGVGMDVVAERLRAMKGSVAIRSEPAAGCEIQLRFQATLVSQHALLVRCEHAVYAVPSHHVEIALAADMAEYVIDEGRPAVTYRGGMYPLYALARLAGFSNAPVAAASLRTQPVLIVRAADRMVAVTCDRLLDGRELIVKPAGRYLRALPGLAGAVVLPTGQVAPVLDLPDLIVLEQARSRTLDGVLSHHRAVAEEVS